MKRSILGYQIEAQSGANVIQQINHQIDQGRKICTWMACINPHSYVVAKSDTAFARALKQATWLVPDGVGVVIAAKLLRQPITERITGFDIFQGVMDHIEAKSGRVFFLGGTEQTLTKIREKLPRDYPNIELVGTYSPPFKPIYDAAEIEAMVDAVNAAKPDVLWVGMTAPKQEKWVDMLAPRLQLDFAGAIGAVFDFYTGQVKRSPIIFQKLGLEWLPRLLQQPRRLWKRMFVSAPIFILDVFRERFGPRSKPEQS